HHVADFLDAREHRAERNEVRARDRRDDARQRRLAGSRRPPENDRTQAVLLDGHAERTAGAEQRVLADDVVERAGPPAFGERRPGVCRAGGRAGIVAEQVHQLWFPDHGSPRCRDASYRITAAAIATLSDSTGARIGIETVSCAAASAVSETPAPSLPRIIAI